MEVPMVGQTLQGNQHHTEHQLPSIREQAHPEVRETQRPSWFEMSRGDDSEDATEVGAVSKAVGKQVEKFAQKYDLDQKVWDRMGDSCDEAVARVVATELSQRVRNPNALLTRMLQAAEREVASKMEHGSDEGHKGAEDVGDYQGDETWYEDEGGAEGYSRAESDRDDEDDGAWYRGGWHDDDYAEEEGWAEDEQSMSWQEDWQEGWQ